MIKIKYIILIGVVLTSISLVLFLTEAEARSSSCSSSSNCGGEYACAWATSCGSLACGDSGGGICVVCVRCQGDIE